MTATSTRPVVQRVTAASHGIVLELDLPGSLTWFRGHFPERPILPGVVQVAWAIHFACAHLSLDPAVRQVAGLKFQRVIRPGATIRLELEWLPATSTLGFRYSEHGLACSSGRIRLAP